MILQFTLLYELKIMLLIAICVCLSIANPEICWVGGRGGNDDSRNLRPHTAAIFLASFDQSTSKYTD